MILGLKMSEDGEKERTTRFEGPLDEHTQKYIMKLMAERETVDADQYPLVYKLIQKELDSISKGGATPDTLASVDLYNDAPITLNVKAYPPCKIFPKFNYAGRIIGPRGSYLKALMKETMCKLVLLGKGVMKDKEKEEDLRSGSDPKFIHLNEDMHVLISVSAPSAEAFARISYAITCLKQHILSDSKTVESLSWVIEANKHLDGGNSEDKMMMMKPRGGPPPPRGTYRPHPYVGHPHAHPHGHAGDYESLGEPYRRSFTRDPSPSSSRPDPRRLPMQIRPGMNDARAMGFIEKSRLGMASARTPYMQQRSDTPSPEVYESYHSREQYYHDEYDSVDYYQNPGRGYRAVQKSRYAPYKK